MKKDDRFNELKDLIQKEKKIIKEISSSLNYYQNSNIEERNMLSGHITLLKNELLKTNDKIPEELKKINLIKVLPQTNVVKTPEETKTKPVEEVKQKQIEEARKAEVKPEEKKRQEIKKTEVKTETQNKIITSLPKKSFIERIGLDVIYSKNDLKPNTLEKETIKRIKKKREENLAKSKEKPNEYLISANKYFADFSRSLANKKIFPTLGEDLMKANLKYTETSYISTTIFTTLIVFVISIFIALFFLFFRITPMLPIVSFSTAPFMTRVMRVFWMPFIIPIGTFLIMIIYPSLERSSAEAKINQELPFAVINMSAISGSMIDPSKIFKIIITTNEYPNLEKEFKKLINEINIYGYDFVSALKDAAIKSPSKKLGELFNGLATTINSGGNLPEFFDKRAQTLLFEYGLQKEKNTKAAETFMDIYISIVIAAPMILMILLMMMKMSGLGVALSTGTITMIIVTAVAMINVVFLTFLHLKKN
jgi:hypothetical protein